MKHPILIHSAMLALALPLSGFAQDQTAPGKSGDAVKDPASAAPDRPGQPLRTPTEAEREPGKTGDAVKDPNPEASQRPFMGPITAVSRNDKTITIDDTKMGSHKLHIGEQTKIMRKDKVATWDDLKVGAKVGGTCRGGMNKAHAETLNIQD